MSKYMSSKYYNVTIDHINTYRSLCEKCGLKKLKAGMGVVVKPIKVRHLYLDLDMVTGLL